jgi:tetratricopeptide (TPR) repeat protein
VNVRMTSNAPRLLGSIALIWLAVQTTAQAQRTQLSPADAQRLEAALQSNPHDRAARDALLEYYFLAKIDPAVAIPARRRHILWLIENTPDDELAGSPAATIDAAGHWLADPEGFRLASEAWRAQTARRDASAASLVHAAYFFKLSDKAFTIGLLERALALEPDSKEIAARLGDEYALAIMGVTMMNKNGYPMTADSKALRSPLAVRAHVVLETSQNPYLLAKAGYMLLWQGAILHYSGKLALDTAPLAKWALERAVSLAPSDPGVANYMEQYYAITREYERLKKTSPTEALAAKKSSPLPSATSLVAASQKKPSPAPNTNTAAAQPKPPVPQQPVAQQPVPQQPAPSLAPPPPETPPEPTSDDLKQVAVGMTRQQLTKLGAPASRLTMDDDDGHVIEIYHYSLRTGRVGTIRLKDGVVSSIEVP